MGFAMEIWLDSCDKKVVLSACRFGFIYGITSNPSLIAETNEDPEKILNTLLEIQDGPVAVQTTADETEEMIQQALALHALSDRILVKIPVTKHGLIAMKQLVDHGVSVLATAIYQPNQALLAALTKVDYIAPYVGRMFDAGIDAYAALKSISTMYRQYNFKTKILAAGLKTTEQIHICAEMGIDAVALKHSIFNQWTANDPHTMSSLKEFADVWESKSYLSK
jgi:transaldolase